jgi:3-hydroxyisobutyrate dehydrogenase-like beta-hydroxyacid dehydrogenase
MGRLQRHMGPSGAGATIKLINNMLSGVVNTAIAELWSVLEAAGVDPVAGQEILNEGAAGSRATRNKMAKLHQRDFSAQFQLSLMEKDLRYFLQLAQEVDRPAPVASLVRSLLQGARRADLGGLDVAAVFLHMTGEDAPKA